MTCSCGRRASFRYVAPKQLLTTVGVMEVPRRYYACRSCRATYRPWDAWAGVVGARHLTEHARKMVTIVGSAFSFDVAAQRLLDLCQMRISNDTVRRVCDEEGARARRWLNEAPEPAERITGASGHHEFYTDGVKVNTTGGWRELRLSVIARREAGLAIDPADWDERVLPEPTARLAVCAIAGCRTVGASWQRLSRRTNLAAAPDLSVLGDGAKWIWEQAQRRLPKHNTSWCVDVYHVSQHLHDCGKAMFGQGKAAQRWADERLSTALSHNGPALVERLKNERDGTDDGRAAAIDRMIGYLEDNRDSLWYRDRLQQGKPIGSGLIEGCCKTAIAARLKINSARWRVRRAERMGALRCVEYSGLTRSYWHTRAA